MGDTNFDPFNGQSNDERINELLSKGYKYDPVTGEPLWTKTQPVNPAYNTDPLTGQAVQHTPVSQVNQVSNATNSRARKQTTTLAIVAIAFLTLILIFVGLVGSIVNNRLQSRNGSDPDVTVSGQDSDSQNTPISRHNTTGNIKDYEPEMISTFTINGYSYELPMKVQDIVNDDWVFNDDHDMTAVLGSGENKYVYIHVPGDITNNTIEFTVTNFSLDAQELKDCYITGVEFYEVNADRMGNTISTCNDEITLCESTSSDVKRVLGDPDHITDLTTSIVYSYYYDHDSANYNHEISFHIEADTDRVHIITLRNQNAPADFVQAEVQEGYVPEYLGEYVAPQELGDDILSGNIEIDGKVYNVPVPMSVLLADGWELKDENEAVGAYDNASVSLLKGNAFLYVQVENYTDRAVYLENTIVTDMSFYKSAREKMSVKFPGGFDLNVTDKEFVEILESNGVTNYEYRKDYRTYRIPFDQSSKASYYDNELIVTFYEDGSFDYVQIVRKDWAED